MPGLSRCHAQRLGIRPQAFHFIDSNSLPGYYSPLMSGPVEFIDPWGAADKGIRLEGRVPVSELERLARLLADQRGEVLYSLHFYRDARRRACVDGKVVADLRLTCQRCLEPVEIAVDSVIALALVQGVEEAQRLPDPYDPLLAPDEGIRPLDLVEEEVLLALPQVPRHGPAEPCDTGDWLKGQAATSSAEQPEATADTDNPFSVLAQLKERLH